LVVVKHAWQQQVTHKYMKEHEDSYVVIVESICLMALAQLF